MINYPHSDGSEVVIKVYAKNDLLLQLAPYEKKLHGGSTIHTTYCKGGLLELWYAFVPSIRTIDQTTWSM